jgi:hypothetical protein
MWEGGFNLLLVSGVHLKDSRELERYKVCREIILTNYGYLIKQIMQCNVF